MTAHELAEHLEVSERTIYRDIEALSFAGIPLYTEHGPGGGYELLGGYQTRLNGLTIQEVRALFLLSFSTSLTDLGLDQTLEDAFLKISAALPASFREQAAQVRQRIYVDTTQPPHSKRVIFHLELIQEAIWHDSTLCLTYQGFDRRFFNPYGLVSHRGTWYLVGASEGMVHTVRVEHIQAAELNAQHFTRPPAFDLATYWAQREALLKRAQTRDRESLAQKKARSKTNGATRMTPQKGATRLRSRRKKKHFLHLPCTWPCVVSSPLTLFSKSILEPCSSIIAA